MPGILAIILISYVFISINGVVKKDNYSGEYIYSNGIDYFYDGSDSSCNLFVLDDQGGNYSGKMISITNDTDYAEYKECKVEFSEKDNLLCQYSEGSYINNSYMHLYQDALTLTSIDSYSKFPNTYIRTEQQMDYTKVARMVLICIFAILSVGWVLVSARKKSAIIDLVSIMIILSLGNIIYSYSNSTIEGLFYSTDEWMTDEEKMLYYTLSSDIHRYYCDERMTVRIAGAGDGAYNLLISTAYSSKDYDYKQQEIVVYPKGHTIQIDSADVYDMRFFGDNNTISDARIEVRNSGLDFIFETSDDTKARVIHCERKGYGVMQIITDYIMFIAVAVVGVGLAVRQIIRKFGKHNIKAYIPYGRYFISSISYINESFLEMKTYMEENNVGNEVVISCERMIFGQDTINLPQYIPKKLNWDILKEYQRSDIHFVNNQEGSSAGYFIIHNYHKQVWIGTMSGGIALAIYELHNREREEFD